jgi:Penicillin binding protein transpeptidase domain
MCYIQAMLYPRFLIACLTTALIAPALAYSQSPKIERSYLRRAPCTRALARRAVCEAANQHALDYMKANNLTAVTVVQDVRTGALVAFAASDPAQLDVTTSLLPLSVAKLFIAAGWWQHNDADVFVASDARRISVPEMIVTGSDNAGRSAALELRKTVGADTVIEDLKVFGFPRRASSANSGRDEEFWGEIATAWRERLTPAASYHLLSASSSDEEWAYDLSIGEAGFRVSALSISRFLQAVGNGGVMLPPSARKEAPAANQPANVVNRNIVPRRIMRKLAAVKLPAPMRDVVQTGTAKGIAQALYDTRWSIGGKTGSSGPVGPQSDGWFAGLIFDPNRKARFTIATFVKHGGTGGGNAARLSANLARYLIASVTD